VLDSVVGTDSHPGSQQLADTPGALCSVAPLLAEALHLSTKR
jgi:ribose-phosphate pyrophosphokinase